MKIDKKPPKLLYLDHNKWVALEQVYYKKKNDSVISSLILNLKDLIDSGKLRVVANLSNFQETSQRTYDASREAMGNLILELTDGYFFLPFVYLQAYEIKDFFFKAVGLKGISLRENAIGKGFGFLMGAMPKAKIDSIDRELLDKINKEAQKHFVKNEFLAELFKQYLTVSEDQKKEYINDTEGIRIELSKLANNLERTKYQINTYFENYFMPKIMREMGLKYEDQVNRTLGLVTVASVIPKNMQNYKERVKFMKNFPMMYTEFCLSTYRDRDLRRKVQWNDLLDIGSLCFPIAYFDYIVAEKYFITLAKQAKLGDLYKTRLLTKLSELLKILAKL